MANQNFLRSGCTIVLNDIAYLYRCGKIDATEKASMVAAVKEALKTDDSEPLKRLMWRMKLKMDPSIYDEILGVL